MMETLTRDELTAQLMAAVKRCAQKYAGWQGIDREDIEQEAMLCMLPLLNDNFQKIFNPDAYAASVVKRAVCVLLKKQNGLSLSRSDMTALMRVTITKRNMQAAVGYEPTVTEIAEEMQIPPAIVRRVLRFSQANNTASLDAPLQNDPNNGTVGDLIIDQRSDTYPESQLLCLDLSEQTTKVLSTLEPVEETTMRLRYGFINDEEYTQRETADELKISLADERMIEIKAMRKLRHPSRSRYLEPFLYDF